MSKKTETYTEADIHYFTDSKGKKWAYIPWGMIAGEIPDNVIYPTTWSVAAFGGNSWRDWDTYPTAGKSDFALVPADRIEIVTEHVEATAMDALQALVASGGKPVEGWKFWDEDAQYHDTLTGVEPKAYYKFRSETAGWKQADRPVNRVRIKAEAVVGDSSDKLERIDKELRRSEDPVWAVVADRAPIALIAEYGSWDAVPSRVRKVFDKVGAR